MESATVVRATTNCGGDQAEPDCCHGPGHRGRAAAAVSTELNQTAVLDQTAGSSLASSMKRELAAPPPLLPPPPPVVNRRLSLQDYRQRKDASPPALAPTPCSPWRVRSRRRRWWKRRHRMRRRRRRRPPTRHRRRPAAVRARPTLRCRPLPPVQHLSPLGLQPPQTLSTPAAMVSYRVAG